MRTIGFSRVGQSLSDLKPWCLPSGSPFQQHQNDQSKSSQSAVSCAGGPCYVEFTLGRSNFSTFLWRSFLRLWIWNGSSPGLVNFPSAKWLVRDALFVWNSESGSTNVHPDLGFEHRKPCCARLSLSPKYRPWSVQDQLKNLLRWRFADIAQTDLVLNLDTLTHDTNIAVANPAWCNLYLCLRYLLLITNFYN